MNRIKIGFWRANFLVCCMAMVYINGCVAGAALKTEYYPLMIDGIQRKLSYRVYEALKLATLPYTTQAYNKIYLEADHHIIFRSEDRRETLRIIQRFAKQEGVQMFYCDLLSIKHAGNVDAIKTLFNQAVTVADQSKQRVVVFLDHFEEIAGASQIFYDQIQTIESAIHSLLEQMKPNQNVVVCASFGGVAPLYRSWTKDYWNDVYIPLPDEQMRTALLKQIFEHLGVAEQEALVNQLETRTAGLTTSDIESLMIQASWAARRTAKWQMNDEVIENSIGFWLHKKKRPAI